MECTEAISHPSASIVEEQEEEEEDEGEENNMKQEGRKSPGSHEEQEINASGHNKEAKEPNSTKHKGI
jgi:hypothetical protein